MFIDTTAARQFIAHYTTNTDIEADLDQLASICKQELIYQDQIENILNETSTEVSQANLSELQRQQQISANLSNQHFAAIWSKSIGIVTHAARNISGGAATSADVYSYALEVLMRSLRKWDKSKHTKFSSYFYGNIQRELFTLTNRKHFRDFYAHNISADFTDSAWTDHLSDTSLNNGVESTAFVSRQVIKRNVYNLLVKQTHCMKSILKPSTSLEVDLGLTQSKLQELFNHICTYYKLEETIKLEEFDSTWLSSMTVGHLIELVHSRVSKHLNAIREVVPNLEQFSSASKVCDPVVYQIPYAPDSPEYQVVKVLLQCNIDNTKALAKALGWKKAYLNKVLTNIRKAYPDARGLV